MRLKIKKLKLEAGRPIVFLHEKTAQKLNIHIGDRIAITQKNLRAIAIFDIVKSLVSEKEVVLSQEVFEYAKFNSKKEVHINLALSPESTTYIIKKLNGKSLSREEIFAVVGDIVDNSLTEAEIAYFVAGVYEKGMSFKEICFLTEAIYKTGSKLFWDKKEIADKHSIGGIAGNRTTPIVVSICAAAGITMPKTSSRAITSAAGTADAMEVLAKVDLSLNDLKRVVKKTNACLTWGGSLGLAPADDKLIRVERLLNLDPEPQLLASIISKKLAAGSKYILIDIPYGPQAKVSKEKARKLKLKFLKIAKNFKLHMHVVLTPADQPIGNGIGPVLEIKDVLRVLQQNNSPKDLENKSIFLAAKILEMMGKSKPGKGEFIARSILETGVAYDKFKEIIDAQGKIKADLGLAKHSYEIKAKKSGKITLIDNKLINYISRVLGCPEDKKAGIYIHHHKNEEITEGQKLLTLYAESSKKLKEAIHFFNESKVIEIN
ncbi:thymidine phosphorylase [Candidatus Pacearchaeota archaeon]|nr:hypothetical protein [uncultured archaeon]AQS33243.1 hypothetical protein [uncultured archaeon]MBS3091536.1 thymidine phosphorylase [Candidatus Pacearchaeota archaeon]